MSGRSYLTSEQQFLKDYYGCIPLEQIAKKINRTPNNIKEYAFKMGLKGAAPYQYKQQEIGVLNESIKDMIITGATTVELSKTTELTYQGVRYRVYKSGRFASKYGKMLDENNINARLKKGKDK